MSLVPFFCVQEGSKSHPCQMWMDTMGQSDAARLDCGRSWAGAFAPLTQDILLCEIWERPKVVSPQVQASRIRSFDSSARSWDVFRTDDWVVCQTNLVVSQTHPNTQSIRNHECRAKARTRNQEASKIISFQRPKQTFKPPQGPSKMFWKKNMLSHSK